MNKGMKQKPRFSGTFHVDFLIKMGFITSFCSSDGHNSLCFWMLGVSDGQECVCLVHKFVWCNGEIKKGKEGEQQSL